MHVERSRYKKQEREAARRWRGHKREPSSTGRVRRGGAAVGELLAACLNDRERAERLIEYELNRDSGLTREEAVAAALERYRRDNA
jgi:hypothetical protein